MSHTPLPWKVSTLMGDYRIVEIDGYGNTIRLIAVIPEEKNWPNSKDNAAFIVESVNLRPLYEKLEEAAKGLSHGIDWNNGTHAKLHGYRQNLLDALTALQRAKEAK